MLQSVALEKGQKEFLPTPQLWVKPQTGKFTHSFDKGLPGKHTAELYKGRSHHDASILCQLRSGMCKFKKYLARIGSTDSDVCSCGRETESIDHYLFRCSQWLEQRRSIRSFAGRFNRWGDLSFALGDGPGLLRMENYLNGDLLLKWSRPRLNLHWKLEG